MLLFLIGSCPSVFFCWLLLCDYVADDSGEFEGEVYEEKRHEEYIGADEDVSVEGDFHIGAEKECMTDDGNIHEYVEEMRDAPEALRDHGLDPAGEDENDKSVKCHDTERERKRIDFIGGYMKGNKCIGDCWSYERIKEEAYTMEEGKEESLNGNGVVNGEGIGGANDVFEDGESDGDTEENGEPSESESDES